MSVSSSKNETALETVIQAATEAHRGKTRKNGTTPYIVHPRRVATCVEHYGGNQIGIIAAWLHEVIEDCKGGDVMVHQALRNTGLPSLSRRYIDGARTYRCIAHQKIFVRYASLAELSPFQEHPPHCVVPGVRSS